LTDIVGVHRTIVAILELIPRAEAKGLADRAEVLTGGDQWWTQQHNQVATASSRARDQAVYSLANDVAKGWTQARIACYIGVAVRADNAQTINDAKTSLMVKASGAQCECRWLYKKQSPAFTALLPLGRGLR
jgi:hypothetical protein